MLPTGVVTLEPPLKHAHPFALPEARGGVRQLPELPGPAGLLLVFYRGHWCPYCRRYLGKLQANAARFAEQGVGLAAISPEPTATARRLADELAITFPLLSDPGGVVIDQFGVRSGFRIAATAPRSSPVLPHPAVFLIDPALAVRRCSIDRNFKRRTTMHTLFTWVAELHVG